MIGGKQMARFYKAFLALIIVLCIGAYAKVRYPDLFTIPDQQPQETASTNTLQTSTSEIGSDTAFEASANTTNTLFYQGLSESEQQDYRIILYTLQRRDSSAYTGAITPSSAEKVFCAVMADHPELFWVGSKMTMTGVGSAYDNLSFEYTFSESQIAALQDQLTNATADVLAQTASAPTQYQQALIIHDWLVANVDYVDEAPNGQNVLGAILDKQAVCTSYAKAFQYLAQKSGIACLTVTGTATVDDDLGIGSSGSHAWNMATIDSVNTYIDVTFDDPVYLDGTSGDIIYDYFCISSEQIAVNHSAESLFTLPQCSSL